MELASGGRGGTTGTDWAGWTVGLLLCFALLLGLSRPALSEAADALGAAAPGLDAKAPEATAFQLGDHGVAAQTGAASYALEIDVPPGRRGMQPSLSLTYSSRAPLRGGIAAGWSLELPSIQHDTAAGTLAQTAYVAVLGGAGSRLVEVPDRSAFGGTAYRMQQDDRFTRFERIPYSSQPISRAARHASTRVQSSLERRSLEFAQAGTDGIRWVAWTSEGTLHHFGGSAGDARSIWPLAQQIDRHGNTVTYRWDAVTDAAGQVVDYQIRSIDYTSNQAARMDAHARVDFEYASRPLPGSQLVFDDDTGLETCAGSEVPIGASFSLHSGTRRYLGARRLEAVVTSVRDVPGGPFREVERTQLGYDASALRCDGVSAPLRLLTRIDRTAFAPHGSATALAPLRFVYGDDGRSFSQVESVDAAPVHWGTDRELQGMLLEIDGDGIPDRVTMETGARYCELHWYRGQPGGGWAQSARVIPLEDATLPWANGSSPSRGGSGGPERCTLMGQTTYRSNRDNAPMSCTAGNFNGYHFADVDGDGRTDLLSSLSVDPSLYDPYADPMMSEHNPPSLQNPPDPGPGGAAGGGLAQFADQSPAAGQRLSMSPALASPQDIIAQPSARLTSLGGLSQSSGLSLGSGGVDRPNPPPDDEEPLTTYAINRGDTTLTGEGLWARVERNPQPPPPPPCSPRPREPNRHLWRIYRGSGTSFDKMPHYPTAVPVELPGTGNEGSPLRHSMRSADGNALIDIDGDGRLDAIRDWTVYAGDGRGRFGKARAWPRPAGVAAPVSGSGGDRSPTEAAAHGGRRSWGTSGLGDVNGDNLPDLLVSQGDGLIAYLNHGRGFGSHPTPLGVDHYLHLWRRATFYGGTGRYDYYRTDVDADGLADLLELRPPESDPYPGVPTPRVYPNVGDRFLTPPRALPPRWQYAERFLTLRGLEDHERVNGAASAWYFQTDALDANGDGRGDLVEWQGDTLRVYSDPTDATPPRLLESVDNGVGAVTRYHYAPSSDASVVSRDAQGDRPLPHVHPVVESITIEDAFGTPAATTRYRYADPVYGSQSGAQGDPPRFLGFRGVTRTHPLGSRIEQEYSYEGSGDKRGRLVREITWNGEVPLTLRTIRWRHEPLFGGLATFSHRSSELRRTCSSDLESCASQTGHLARRHEHWEPWVHPETGEQSLYLRSRVEDGQAVGDVYREQLLSHQVCYSDDCFAVLLTASETREGEYGTLRRLETEYEQGLPVLEHRFIDALTRSTTRHTYDPATGNRLTTTKPQQHAGGGEHQSFVYDDHQLFVAATHNELGHAVETRYDPGTGELLQRLGPNPGQEEQRAIDGLGRVTSRTIALDEGDGPGRETVETTTYHDLARPRRLETHRLIDGSEDRWLRTERVFDGVGRQRTERVSDATTYYDYDADGNLAAIHVPDPTRDDGTSVTYEYRRDSVGRLIQFVRPDGSSIEVRYAGLGKQIEEISADGSGGLQILDYDAFERIVRLEEIGGGRGAAIWEYDYDALGNLVGLLGADAHYTEIEYDWMSRRRQIRRADRSWFYDYDLNGNLVAQTSPVPPGASEAAYTTTHAYDALDRELSRDPAPRDISPARRAELGIGPIDFYYDGERGPIANAIGRLSHVALPIGHVSYGYDPRGLATFEQSRFGVATPVAASATQWVGRSYNALGRETRVEHDDGTLLETLYDDSGRVDRVEWYDPGSGRWLAIADFERSLAGQIRERATDFQQRRRYEYDALGRPLRDRIFGGPRRAMRAWREYAYNGSGDLSAVRGQNLKLDASASYFFDGLHRLVSASGPRGYEGRFEYSPGGNLLSAQVDWSGSEVARDVSYEYGDVDPQAVDRLVDRVTGSPHAHFAYDMAGNVVARATVDAQLSLTWDGSDQLREAATSQGYEIYHYDHRGNRVLALDPERGARFWFGASETHFDPAGAPLRRWIHAGAGGSVLARIENAGQIQLQYADSLQNLMLSLDSDGWPLAHFLYGPFGEVLNAKPNPQHRRRFNGKEHDALSGLRYYGFRYYDALALRWNGSDPLYRFRPEVGLDDPQRTNLYAFSRNNPVRYLDPDGRDVVITWGVDPKDKGFGRSTRNVANQLKRDLVKSGIKAKNIHVVPHTRVARTRKTLDKRGRKVKAVVYSGHGAQRGQVDPSGQCASSSCNSPNPKIDELAADAGLEDGGAMVLLSCFSVDGDSEAQQNLEKRGIEVGGFSGTLTWSTDGKKLMEGYRDASEVSKRGASPGDLEVETQSQKENKDPKDDVKTIIQRAETAQ